MANFSNDDFGIFIPPNDFDNDIFSNNSSIQLFKDLIEQVEEEDMATSSRIPKKIVRRDREKGNEVLMNDYFVEEPKYNDDVFRYQFRMSKRLFLKIVGDVEAQYPWFQEGYEGRMKKSFTTIQNVTSALKQLATGNTPDEGDEFLCMSERTSRECLQFFCNAVNKMYGDECRQSDVEDSRALIAEQRESVAKATYDRDFKTYTRPHDHLEDEVKKIAITRKREIAEKYNWPKDHLV